MIPATTVVAMVCWAALLAWLDCRASRAARQRRIERQHLQLLERHDRLLNDWHRREQLGMRPTARMVATEEFVWDLLDDEEPCLGQLARAEALLADLERERWVFAN